MKKTIIKIAIIFLVLLLAVTILKNPFAKYALKRGFTELGAKAEIGKINLNILKTTIQANNLTIYNPPGFQEKIMAEIPDLFVDFNLNDLLKKKWHFSEIRLNLKSLDIEKTKDGRINVEELKTDEDEQPATGNGYQIDTLVLSLGHVKAVDYSHGTSPNILETDMEMKDKVFHNVSDTDEIADIIIHKIASEHIFLSLGLTAGKMVGMGAETVGIVGKEAGELAGAILPFGHGEKTKSETPKETEPETQPKKEPKINIQPTEQKKE